MRKNAIYKNTMYEISDFKTGQTAYVENLAKTRRGYPLEQCFFACDIEKVGRKYVTADRKQFEESDYYKGGLVEHSDYSPEYVLWPSLEAITEKFEKEKLYNRIKTDFSYSSEYFSLEDLRKISEILYGKEA